MFKVNNKTLEQRECFYYYLRSDFKPFSSVSIVAFMTSKYLTSKCLRLNILKFP